MLLTKDTISQITFTCKRRKYYLASQVDQFLDEMAEAADKQQKELSELRAKCAEYEKNQQSIASTLVYANAGAADIMENARREKEAVLAGALEEKKKLDEANDVMFQRTLQLKKALYAYTGDMESWVNRVLAIHNGAASGDPAFPSIAEREEQPGEGEADT